MLQSYPWLSRLRRAGCGAAFRADGERVKRDCAILAAILAAAAAVAVAAAAAAGAVAVAVAVAAKPAGARLWNWLGEYVLDDEELRPAKAPAGPSLALATCCRDPSNHQYTFIYVYIHISTSWSRILKRAIV